MMTKIEKDFIVDLKTAVIMGRFVDKQLAINLLSAVNVKAREDKKFENILLLEDNGYANVFEGYYFARNQEELKEIYENCVYDSSADDYSIDIKIGNFKAEVRYAYQNHDDYKTQSGEDRWHIYIIFKLFN